MIANMIVTMKAIVYCCKAAESPDHAMARCDDIPFNYAEILEESRQRYAKAGITGILTYKDGYFFHCMEGSEEQVDRAMRGTFRDPKYNHFEVLLSETVSFRSFEKWTMKAASDARLDNRFTSFIMQYREAFKHLVGHHKDLLASFCGLDSTRVNLSQ